ncbi:uncharacterized protein LOC132259050 isoform X2 [Phlebotomus argentipes]|uniref:uncharacterized protein LOC132259050 isoform X2 n=1 Tax=Phlebotomus argentipes TaxID=94469 RepID=UPI002892C3AD|nr:uncharacterized protein LOC132259050 isoform X2 [Phlebotomus argentipes]
MDVVYLPHLLVGGKIIKLVPDFNQVGSRKADLLHNPIVLESDAVDGKHAILSFDILKGTTQILDLVSKAGTFVDGEKIAPIEWKLLKHGEKVVFGDVETTFCTKDTQSERQIMDNTPSNSNDSAENFKVIPVSLPVKTERILVPDTQHESQCDESFEHVELPETQMPELYKSKEEFDGIFVPETQPAAENEESLLDISLPETEISTPVSRMSFEDSSKMDDTCVDVWNVATQILDRQMEKDSILSDNLLENCVKSDFCELSTQVFDRSKLAPANLTKDSGLNSPASSSLNGVKDESSDILTQTCNTTKNAEERTVLKAGDKRPHSAVTEIKDEDETDCEDELAGFTSPENPQMQPQVKLIRLAHENVCEAATQKFQLNSIRSNISQTSRTISKEPLEAAQSFGSQEGNNSVLAQFRFTNDLSSTFSDDLLTPPCLIALPTRQGKNRPETKDSGKRTSKKWIFPESSDDEDDYTAFSPTQGMKTPEKPRELSTKAKLRLKAIAILDSPNTAMDSEAATDGEPEKPIRKHNSKKNDSKLPKTSHMSPVQLRRSRRAVKRMQYQDFET